MSEQAYYDEHRRAYGCYPDEDQGAQEPEEHTAGNAEEAERVCPEIGGVEV